MFERALFIERCSDKSKWYSHLVGEVVPLLAEEGVEWRSMQPEGYINYVSFSDARVVYINRTTGEVRWNKPD